MFAKFKMPLVCILVQVLLQKVLHTLSSTQPGFEPMNSRLLTIHIHVPEMLTLITEPSMTYCVYSDKEMSVIRDDFLKCFLFALNSRNINSTETNLCTICKHSLMCLVGQRNCRCGSNITPSIFVATLPTVYTIPEIIEIQGLWQYWRPNTCICSSLIAKFNLG